LVSDIEGIRMKNKNAAILFRLIIITGGMLLALILIVRIPDWIRLGKNGNKALKYKSFGIEIPSGYSVHGIDVSRHQSTIDWKQADSMRSGGKEISFAFIKATEGITRKDPHFNRNWQEIKKTNILRGAYHFYYPSRDAEKQATNFISHVKLSKGDLPPVVDIEHSNGKTKKEICKGLQTFLDKIEKKYGVKPIVYTNHAFYTRYLKGSFDNYPLWISFYTDKSNFDRMCNYPWLIWQHSEKGRVNGIEGSVDFNVLNGSIDKLHKLTIR
jgi:lysozyme